MLGPAIGDLLPLALVVALSPVPIIAIVVVLGSARGRTSGPAFAVGWVLGLTILSIVVLLLAGGASEPDSDASTGVDWLKAALGVLLLVLAARRWRKRPARDEAPEMPRWMATVDSMSVPKEFGLGLLLSAANPKNAVLTVAAAASIAQAGLDATDDAIAIAVFVALASITVVGPVLFSLVAPRTAARPLEAVRQFMSDHQTAIMVVLLLVIGAKLLGDALAGLSN